MWVKRVGMVVLVLCSLLLSDRSMAQTTTAVVVNSILDTVATDGVCTLREAILTVNGSPRSDCPGTRAIQFNIPGGGVKRIVLSSPLPPFGTVAASSSIDGYTQPGAMPNTLSIGGSNATPLIEIDGSNLPLGEPALVIIETSRLSGLIIHSAGGVGLLVICPQRITTQISGNFIGVDSSGSHARLNENGAILISSTNVVMCQSNLTIGGPNPADRNVIAGDIFTAPESLNTSVTQRWMLSVQNNVIGAAAKNQSTVLASSRVDLRSHSGIQVLDNFIVGGLRFSDESPASLVIQRNQIQNPGSIGIEINRICPTTAARIESNVITAQTGIHYFLGESQEADCPNGEGARLSRNVIYAQQAIDLGREGLNAPDLLDGDRGPNGLQNPPVFSSAQTDGLSFSLNSTLYSTPGVVATLDYFLTQTCDLSSGRGGAEIFLGSHNVTVGSSGSVDVLFSPRLPALLPAGDYFITATASARQLITAGVFSAQTVTSEAAACLPVTPMAIKLDSAIPNSFVAGGASTELALTGAVLTPGTTVLVNGIERKPTSVLRSVKIPISAAELAVSGSLTVQLKHPDGMTSNSLVVPIKDPAVGVSVASPESGILSTDTQQAISLTWTHPSANWRALDTLDVRLEDADDLALWLRFSEGKSESGDASTFTLLNADGSIAGSGRGGDQVILESDTAWLYLNETRFQGSGTDPDDRSVTLTFTFRLRQSAIYGRSFSMNTYLYEDSGLSEGPQTVGLWQAPWSHHLVLPLVMMGEE